ncbi:endolytic transglycosylase MltG, partial [Myxococcota bacterium]|nr:endolytic transglycosylase MltG [Myxococcota bacterium]
MRLFVRLVAAVAVIAALAAGGAWVWLDRSANTPLDPRGAAAEPREIRVPKGATLSQVGQQLQEEKLISSAFVWKLWVRVHGGPSPKAGRHPVHAGMTIPELL